MAKKQKMLPQAEAFSQSIKKVLECGRHIVHEEVDALWVVGHINLKYRESMQDPPWYALLNIGFYEKFIKSNEIISEEDKDKLQPIYRDEEHGYEVHRIDYFSAPNEYVIDSETDITSAKLPIVEQVHPGFSINIYPNISFADIQIFQDEFDVLSAVNLRNQFCQGNEEFYLNLLNQNKIELDLMKNKNVCLTRPKIIYNNTDMLTGKTLKVSQFLMSN